MPFITNRGQQIQYTVTGDGPTVVLQHGLFQRGDDWRRDGYVDAFSDAYRVVCVDSLGHGESDKPLGPAAYRRAARAADITGVLDELGVSRAHLIGYSMGGWISSGVAVENPDRLASLVVGGWDLVDGANKIAAEIIGFTGDSLTFDDVLAGVRTLDPNLVAWVTPEAEPGLRECWAAIAQLENGASAVAALSCPVLLWQGQKDPAHDPMRVWAQTHGRQFLSVQGDHLGAFVTHAKESIEGLRLFVDRAERPG